MGSPLDTTSNQTGTLPLHQQLLIGGYVVAVILFNTDPALTVIPKVIAPVVGFVFLVLVLGYGRKIHVPMAYRIWAVWFFVAIISTLLADELRLGRLITLAQLAGIGLIITNFLVWSRDTRFYRLALLAGATLSILWIFADPGGFSRADGRLEGTIGNANAHGMLMSVVMITAIAAALSKKPLLVRVSMSALALLFFTTLLQTGSRKAMLGGVLIGGGILLFLYLYHKWRCRDGTFGISLSASLLIIPAVLAAVIASDFWRRVEQALEPGEDGLTADSSLNTRIWMIRRAIELWGDQPVIGHGIGGFARAPEADHLFAMSIASYSHSNYAELLVATGLVGLLLYVLIYALLGTKLVALRKLLGHREFFERYSSLVAILALIVIYDVAAVSYYGKLFWLVLPWLIAEVHLLETEQRALQMKKIRIGSPSLRPG
jgi:O-antigen ligase